MLSRTLTRFFFLIWHWTCWKSSGDGALFNILRTRQNCCFFAKDIFKCISYKIALKLVPQVQIKKFLALVQIIASRRPGDKPCWLMYRRIYASLGLMSYKYGVVVNKIATKINKRYHHISLANNINNKCSNAFLEMVILNFYQPFEREMSSNQFWSTCC